MSESHACACLTAGVTEHAEEGQLLSKRVGGEQSSHFMQQQQQHLSQQQQPPQPLHLSSHTNAHAPPPLLPIQSPSTPGEMSKHSGDMSSPSLMISPHLPQPPHTHAQHASHTPTHPTPRTPTALQTTPFDTAQPTQGTPFDTNIAAHPTQANPFSNTAAQPTQAGNVAYTQHTAQHSPPVTQTTQPSLPLSSNNSPPENCVAGQCVVCTCLHWC